ncbi:hypothetical protein I7I51_06030 [Histoplasma capsulatum]|uniref:Uncharacterized protein n=1 Tax=Ajellomyces capsulatus TaxID=5037 RepID=A0A8A1MEY6_AJECA|nr:hypothetical protein I7I51_06030 [Histoplasma capsulatum]
MASAKAQTPCGGRLLGLGASKNFRLPEPDNVDDLSLIIPVSGYYGYVRGLNLWVGQLRHICAGQSMIRTWLRTSQKGVSNSGNSTQEEPCKVEFRGGDREKDACPAESGLTC